MPPHASFTPRTAFFASRELGAPARGASEKCSARRRDGGGSGAAQQQAGGVAGDK